MTMIATDRRSVIVGAGLTGQSCARFLQRKGRPFLLMDSREAPPNADALIEAFGERNVVTGGLDAQLLKQADEILLSPGVPLSTPEIQEAISAKVPVRGDIDIFAEEAKAPIVAITGSNGKSTVTTLLGEMAKENGTTVAVGGNIGVPALDLLSDEVELYVLELSSFQLETTHALNAEAVTLLNISEDHMDRYPSKMAYLQAKQRIFMGAKQVVVNDDDALSQPLLRQGMKLHHYGMASQDLGKFSVGENEGVPHLFKGFDALVALKEFGLQGRHNVSNILAAMTLGSAMGLRLEAMLSAAKRFGGLPHRCQTVRVLEDVCYINDSKGTNTGATVVAINSFGESIAGKVVLLAGGVSKDADMAPLKAPMQKYGKAAVVYGQDADSISGALSEVVPLEQAGSFNEAVRKAHDLASAGDAVLFSPACASFDMFQNFEARGEAFCQEVMQL